MRAVPLGNWRFLRAQPFLIVILIGILLSTPGTCQATDDDPDIAFLPTDVADAKQGPPDAVIPSSPGDKVDEQGPADAAVPSSVTTYVQQAPAVVAVPANAATNAQHGPADAAIPSSPGNKVDEKQGPAVVAVAPSAAIYAQGPANAAVLPPDSAEVKRDVDAASDSSFIGTSGAAADTEEEIFRPGKLLTRQAVDDAVAPPPANNTNAKQAPDDAVSDSSSTKVKGDNVSYKKVGKHHHHKKSARQAQTSAPAAPGNCYGYCIREVDGDCAEDTDINNLPTVDCHIDAGDAKNVRCITFQLTNKGPLKETSKTTKTQDREAERINGKGCMVGYGYKGGSWGGYREWNEKVDRASCAMTHLNINLKDGKCYKGLYSRDLVQKFMHCGKGEFYPTEEADYMDPDRDPITGLPYLVVMDPSDTKDEGLYWGEYGRVQYVELVICSCKGDLCNDKPITSFSKATQYTPS